MDEVAQLEAEISAARARLGASDRWQLDASRLREVAHRLANLVTIEEFRVYGGEGSDEELARLRGLWASAQELVRQTSETDQKPNRRKR
jgi:hypothetical protein